MKQGICLSLSELRTLLTRSKAERDRITEFVDLSGQELCRLSEEEAAELAACLSEKQLPCMGIHSTFPAEIALIGTKKSELELEAYIRRLVRRCELLDCRIIGVGSPVSRQRDEQQTEAEADKQMVQTLQLLAQLVIQCRKRLIEQQQTRFVDHRAGDGHALLLAGKMWEFLQICITSGSARRSWKSWEKTFGRRSGICTLQTRQAAGVCHRRRTRTSGSIRRPLSDAR